MKVNIVANTYNLSSKTYSKKASVNFCAKLSASELIEKIGEENFPSIDIVNILKELDFRNKFSLYDIHIARYEGLLDCSTLDEAKEKYPEFQDVIDAKDITLLQAAKSRTLQAIINGKIEGIDIDTLSLECLKKYYGRLLAPHIREEYHNFSQGSTNVIFDILNIPRMDKKYFREVIFSGERYRNIQRENTARMWENDSGQMRENLAKMIISAHSEEANQNRRNALQKESFKKRQSVAQKESWENDDGHRREASSRQMRTVLQSPEIEARKIAAIKSQEHRQHQSEKMKAVWENDDGTKREAVRQSAYVNLHTPETKQKVKDFLQSDRNKKAHALAYERHPEIRKMMKDVAKNFGALGKILEKPKDERTDEELKYLNIYYKKCEEAMPGFRKIIGDEVHRIFQEENMD
ncbi:hypothetical protein IJ531_02250 [bacterium]|nr:hypothetical protein [bacterium]